MKTELTAADLALYLGCEVKYRYVFTGEIKHGVLHGVKIQPKGTWCSILGKNEFHHDGVWLHFSETPPEVQATREYENQLVYPILRPLYDMTEGENENAQKIVDAGGWGYEAAIAAELTVYLLSIGIDLFGWIEAGLALDKTKMETK